MADNKVTIEISVEGNGQVQFKKLGDSAEQFAAQAKKGFLDVGRIFDNFVANLASNAVSGAFNFLKDSISSLNGIIGDSIKAAVEQEDAINKLNSALKISGQYSGAASQELQDYASALQATTKYGDETILSTTALISSLGQLDTEGLKKATAATLDLASATGIDLNTAAQLVGKAAAGEVSALKRYGVEVKDTGDKSRDFATALEKINKQFGGSAAAQVNTFSGAMAQLKNTYGDALEVIGDTVIKSPAVLEAFKFISAEIIKFTAYLSENKSAVSGFISQGLVFLVDAFKAVVLAVNVTVGAFKVVEGSLQALLNGIIKIGNSLGVFSAFGTTAEALGKILEEDTAGGIEKVTTAFQGFEGANEILDRLKAKIEEVNGLTAESGQIAQEVANNRVQIEADEEITKEAKRQNAIIAQETEQSQALQSYANYLFARNEALKKYDTDEAKAQIAANNNKLNQIKNSTQASANVRLQISEKLAESQRQIEEQRKNEQLNTLQRISTLSNAKTKELAIAGKAAAIALATIDTYKGANSALASVPFPFNFVAAAAVITAGLVNVSNIIGTPLATGITQVPAGFQNDTFPARLSSGERVVSAPQNKDLTEFLSGSSGLTAKIDELISVIGLNQGRLSVSIDGREIVTAIQNQVDSGRSLNV